MRFDDRLLTVLSQPAGDRHDAAVRWRQLVDLVARAGPESDSPIVAQALDTIRADAPAVDEDLRAAAARAVAGRPLPIALIEYLVSDRLAVSAPVLAAATLDPAQWRALLRLADDETAAVHRGASFGGCDRRASTYRGQPQPAQAETPTGRQPAATPARAAVPSLSDVVARIERRRRNRGVQRWAVAETMPAEAPALFRWECGPSGEIAWVDGAPRGALIGRSIARVSDADGDRVDEEVVRAFALRAPFRDAALKVAGEGLVAGSWKISGVPAFDPTDGRFAGYRGIAQRESARRLRAPKRPGHARRPRFAPRTRPRDQDSAQRDHRLRRDHPGPISRPRRSPLSRARRRDRRAGTAAACCDRRSRFRGEGPFRRGSASAASGPGRAVERMLPTLRRGCAARGVELELASPSRDCLAAVEPELADRLIIPPVRRADRTAAPGERLRVGRPAPGTMPPFDLAAGLTSRPSAMNCVQRHSAAEGGGDLAGFSLRLVRGLARIAGEILQSARRRSRWLFPAPDLRAARRYRFRRRGGPVAQR